MTAELTLTAAGDAMITARMRTDTDPKFEKLVDLVQSADVAPINLEVLLHDFEGYPASNGPGTYMRAPPWVANELTWMGFDMFSVATNHAMDYTHGGMEATMQNLEDRNIPYAGMGRDLTTARQPAYVDTPAGRVALVSACSTITTGSVAGKSRPGMHGRPGIAPLRFDTRYRMPEDAFEQLYEISENLGLEGYKQWMADLGFPLSESEDGFRFLNLNGSRHPDIVPGEEFGIERVPNQDDVDALTEQLDHASRQADWVVASLHSHEGDGARSTDETVAPFLEDVARKCIDAGADAFVGHGSHTLRGIEIYDGAPIFYSLGNLIAQNELIERLPAEMYDRYGFSDDATAADVFDARNVDGEGNQAGFLSDRGYFETVLPICEFNETGLSELTLYPVDLQMEKSRAQRGRPILATEEHGKQIFDRLQELSASYGTEIDVRDERAIVVL